MSVRCRDCCCCCCPIKKELSVAADALPLESPECRGLLQWSPKLVLRSRAALLLPLSHRLPACAPLVPELAAAAAPLDQLALRPSKCSPEKAAFCEEEEREVEMGVRYSCARLP